MARILLGWEFGAGRGHIGAILRVAGILSGVGHEVHLAVQRPDLVPAANPLAIRTWQAPVSPRFLVNAARATRRMPVTMGDILARLGMDDPAIVAGTIRSWLRLFQAVRPEIVIADFAPFLLTAARGRLASVLIGTGFAAAPAHLATFPRLIDQSPAEPEESVLARANEGLAQTGSALLDALPRAFDASARLVEGLAELDPYRDQRVESLLSPVPAGFDIRADGGEEVFVYAPETVPAGSALWKGLAASGLRVRAHVPSFDEGLRRRLDELGIIAERDRVPFADIARQSRLLVSHGAPRFISEGLLAGLPHVVFHYDLEKLLNGHAVAKLGLGGHVALAALDPARFGADLAKLHADDALASRARDARERLRARKQPQLDTAVVETIAALE